jgi:hypothetical protein
MPCFQQPLALLPEDTNGPKSMLETFLFDIKACLLKKTSYKRNKSWQYTMDFISSEKVIVGMETHQLVVDK